MSMASRIAIKTESSLEEEEHGLLLCSRDFVVTLLPLLVWIQAWIGWRIAIEVHQEDTSHLFDLQTQKVGDNRNEIRDLYVGHQRSNCTTRRC